MKNQADAKENGLYLVSESNWTRSKDCQGSLQNAHGLIVTVSYGIQNTNTLWILPVNRTLTIDRDELIFYAYKPGGARLSFGENMQMIHIPDSCPKEELKNRNGFLSYGQKKTQHTFWKLPKAWDCRSSLLLFDHLGQLANYFSEHTDTESQIPSETWQATGPTADAHVITRAYLDLRLQGTTTGGIGSFVVHPEGAQPANTIRLTSDLQKILYTTYTALCDVIGETYGPTESRLRQVTVPAYHDSAGDVMNACDCGQYHSEMGCPWNGSGNYMTHACTSGCRIASTTTVYDLYYTIPTILIAYGGALPEGMAISMVAR